MAYIKLTIDHELQDGEVLTFKSPCACNEVEGIKVHYVVLTETGTPSNASKAFTFRDAHGNNLTGIGNLFSRGACLSVTFDTVNNGAYVKNADTNAYLESKLVYLDGAKSNLQTQIDRTNARFIYSETQPSGSAGDIWLKPIVV